VAGNYTLTASATDTNGATTISAVVNVTVNTNKFPTATLRLRSKEADIFAPTNIAITATAADADGTVVRLALFADNDQAGRKDE
jgi:hypothetical protein